MKKVVSLILVVLMSGCSLLKTNNFVEVSVTCSPTDAIASLNGDQRASPAVYRVVQNKDIDVSCMKEGYITSEATSGTSITGTGVLDAIGTVFFLFPGIGLISPGAWELDQTEFEFNLVEASQ